MEHSAERLVFAVRWNAVPAVMLLLNILVVSTIRLSPDAIDPIDGTESHALAVHRRVLANTFEQLFLFFVASTSLATLLASASINLIPALAIVFTLGRIAFWLGYLRDPMFRSLGFVATIWPNTIMLVYVAYRAVRGCFQYYSVTKRCEPYGP